VVVGGSSGDSTVVVVDDVDSPLGAVVPDRTVDEVVATPAPVVDVVDRDVTVVVELGR
jgi:hypothetical protein